MKLIAVELLRLCGFLFTREMFKGKNESKHFMIKAKRFMTSFPKALYFAFKCPCYFTER